VTDSGGGPTRPCWEGGKQPKTLEGEEGDKALENSLGLKVIIPKRNESKWQEAR